MGKQLNAAEAMVFYTKTRLLFIVDNNRSATAVVDGCILER